MVDIYYIEYITMKSFSDYESISGVNPLYFIVGEVGGLWKKVIEISIYFLLLQMETKK